MAKPMAKDKKAAEQKRTQRKVSASITLGDYAHTVIGKQYQRLIKQEAGVLDDQDPECLHQMRVATRRLRTALQVFGAAVEIPKPAADRRLRALAKELGKLRDLDVQIAALKDDYAPHVAAAEQKAIRHAIEQLYQQRDSAKATVQATLTKSKYNKLKTAYEDWLQQPQYTRLAQLPLSVVSPDLLIPLLSELLLHPGWLIATAESNQAENLLHDLRKTCKHARYQAEFFSDCYGKSFQGWVKELKQLQDNLGLVQDTHVLLAILTQAGSTESDLPELHNKIQAQQAHAMSDWDEKRAKYQDSNFRRSLYRMILKPILPK